VCKQADAAYLTSSCKHSVQQPRRGLHAATAAPSAVGTLLAVARREGVRTLWSGLTPSLLMAVPSTALYFTAYDELKGWLELAGQGGPVEYLAPALSGIAARTAAVTVVSPLELLRTKAMHQKSRLTMAQALAAEVRAGGWPSLWRGWAPTLFRDVPFSGVYWFGYEGIKRRLAPWVAARSGRRRPGVSTAAPDAVHTFGETFSIAFLSGLGAGTLAAALTTPFDVVKTRRQVAFYEGVAAATVTSASDAARPAAAGAAVQRSTSTLHLLRRIAAEEGAAGLFAGLPARLAKVAPSCAIMISSYEVGKRVFATVAPPGSGGLGPGETAADMLAAQVEE
jgi:solute carrier family 25 protein 39/40